MIGPLPSFIARFLPSLFGLFGQNTPSSPTVVASSPSFQRTGSTLLTSSIDSLRRSAGRFFDSAEAFLSSVGRQIRHMGEGLEPPRLSAAEATELGLAVAIAPLGCGGRTGLLVGEGQTDASDSSRPPTCIMREPSGRTSVCLPTLQEMGRVQFAPHPTVQREISGLLLRRNPGLDSNFFRFFLVSDDRGANLKVFILARMQETGEGILFVYTFANQTLSEAIPLQIRNPEYLSSDCDGKYLYISFQDPPRLIRYVLQRESDSTNPSGLDSRIEFICQDSRP